MKALLDSTSITPLVKASKPKTSSSGKPRMVKIDYPATTSQQATALRRGWLRLKDGSWKAPDNLTNDDLMKIKLAETRRQRRLVGAD